MSEKIKIAIVGGGVAGSTTALYLGQLGLDVTLFEKTSSISSGPPYCHLHAGGNLYREISDEQCLTLLRQSIDFLRTYPFCIDYRPTVIALPITDPSSPNDLLPRLELLSNAYKKLIEENPQNQVLGESQNYYKLYDKEQIEALKSAPIQAQPSNLDEWMIPAIQHLDLDKIQFPLILVQEYGINLFRFASGVELALKELGNVTFHPNTNVEKITKKEALWSLSYNNHSHQQEEACFDYLINATGYKTGSIDDMIGIKSQSTHRKKGAS